MYCRVIACDYDGTGSSDDQGLAIELTSALRAAREQGAIILLVTGRVLDDLRLAGMDFSAFDGVVAENGAVVHLPALGRTDILGAPPAPAVLAALREQGVAFTAGAVVVATWEQQAGAALDVIRSCGVDAQLVFNRSALMLLPSAVNKASGVGRALAALSRSVHNMIAFGDAENDQPLFAVAEMAVAARGAVPSVAAVADERLSHPGGDGVARFIQHLMARRFVVPTPPRHDIVLGVDTGGPVGVPGSGMHVMVSGDPKSGKSWIAGLITERLLDRGYRLCVLDPEGDYLPLAERPEVLAFGDRLTLPPAPAVPGLLERHPFSIVLSLARLPPSDRAGYAVSVLAALEHPRLRTGIPHWIVVDEAQAVFREGQPLWGSFAADNVGSMLLITYRPSLVARNVLAAVRAYLIQRTTVEDERYFVTGLLQARGPAELQPENALRSLEPSRTGLLIEDDGGPRWRVFTPDERGLGHRHHGRQYFDGGHVPEHRAFRFLAPAGNVIALARNVKEFVGAVESVPPLTLGHHLEHGDFSRWVRDVLGDTRLASGLRRLEQSAQVGRPPNREELAGLVREAYVL